MKLLTKLSFYFLVMSFIVSCTKDITNSADVTISEDNIAKNVDVSKDSFYCRQGTFKKIEVTDEVKSRFAVVANDLAKKKLVQLRSCWSNNIYPEIVPFPGFTAFSYDGGFPTYEGCYNVTYLLPNNPCAGCWIVPLGMEWRELPPATEPFLNPCNYLGGLRAFSGWAPGDYRVISITYPYSLFDTYNFDDYRAYKEIVINVN